MESNCALVIAASVQALATVILVFVTRWYAKKTSEIAEATKENVAASKAMAEEINRNNKRQRQKGLIYEFLCKPPQTTTGQIFRPLCKPPAIATYLSEKKETIDPGDLTSLLYEMIMEKTVVLIGSNDFQAPQ